MPGSGGIRYLLVTAQSSFFGEDYQKGYQDSDSRSALRHSRRDRLSGPLSVSP